MKIICIGDNNVDIYPEDALIFPGGNCVNVAAFSAMSGAEACYIGNIGNDTWGNIQESALHNVGVSTYFFRHNEKTSSAEVRLYGKDRRFFAYDNQIHKAHPLKLSPDLIHKIARFDLVHTTRYSIFECDTIREIVACGKPISYDFSNDWEPNEPELLSNFLTFSFFSCDNLSEDEIWDHLQKVVHFGCGIAIATKGANGAFAYDGEIRYRQPAFYVDPIDTLGAGDSFIARFLQTYFDLSLANQSSLKTLASHSEHPDILSLRKNIIQVSLSQAALFSANVCLKKASFANPVQY